MSVANSVTAGTDLPDRIMRLERSIDDMWLVIAGAQVLLMQLGFAYLEGGCVRFKNMQSIMIKVFSNAAISIIMTWLIGYAFMFGKNNSNNFIGTDLFAGQGFDEDTHHYAHFVFQAAVGAAANSIVSGGAAERMSFVGYMILSVAFSGWIYPVVIHWAYDGWLFMEGYHDFAGSGAIHMTAAIGALTTTIMLRPRTNRFNPKLAEEFEPCNITYVTLSTLSLYFCWMFFNAGSSLAISGDKIYVVATAGMNTMLSGASGGLTVFIIHYLRNRGTNQRYSLLMMCNGNLAGLVAITGQLLTFNKRPCDNVEAWAAILFGILGGIVYVLVAKLLFYLQIDDPVDAIPIHGGCGTLGAILVGIFNREKGLIYGFGGRSLGVQLLGIICFAIWSFVFHFIVLLFLRYMGLLRIDESVEKKGIDNSVGGGPAYYYEPVDMVDFGDHSQLKTEISQVRDTHHH